MRAADLQHITELVPAVERGQLTRSEVVSLFALIRDHAPHGSNLRDIGDAVVHKRRDKGVSFDVVNRVADGLLGALMEGGEFEIARLYPVGKVVEELADFYRSRGVAIDARRAQLSRRSFGLAIGNMLDGTRVKTRHAAGSYVLLHGGRVPSYQITLARDAVTAPIRAGNSVGGPMLLDPPGSAFGVQDVMVRQGDGEFHRVPDDEG